MTFYSERWLFLYNEILCNDCLRSFSKLWVQRAQHSLFSQVGAAFWKGLRLNFPSPCLNKPSENGAKLLYTHRHIYTCPRLVNNHVINNYEVKYITTALRRTYSAPLKAECLPKMNLDDGQLLPAASLGPHNECQSSPSPANCSSCRCGQ